MTHAFISYGLWVLHALNGIVEAVRNKCADALADQIDVGTTNPNGALQIWTAGFGTLLGTISFQDPAFGPASGGIVTANAMTDETNAPASGTAGVCRFVDRDGNAVCNGTVTATGGGGDVELNTVVITSGDTLSVTSGTFTSPAG